MDIAKILFTNSTVGFKYMCSYYIISNKQYFNGKYSTHRFGCQIYTTDIQF